MAVSENQYQYSMTKPLVGGLPAIESIRIGDLEVCLSDDPELILAAQQLRYEVFYEEGNAQSSNFQKILRLDQDLFDTTADHLLVIDHGADDGRQVVGTYRLLRQEAADKLGGFYTSHEFDIGGLQTTGNNLLELGRSCVHKDYRTKKVMDILWHGLAAYIQNYNIDFMFGCASFPGVKIDKYHETFSYLYHHHLARSAIRPKALENQFIPLNWMNTRDLDVKRAIKNTPPLIKGYLRTGAVIGDGAVIDSQFGTVDICILIEIQSIAERYSKHYMR